MGTRLSSTSGALQAANQDKNSKRDRFCKIPPVPGKVQGQAVGGKGFHTRKGKKDHQQNNIPEKSFERVDFSVIWPNLKRNFYYEACDTANGHEHFLDTQIPWRCFWLLTGSLAEKRFPDSKRTFFWKTITHWKWSNWWGGKFFEKPWILFMSESLNLPTITTVHIQQIYRRPTFFVNQVKYCYLLLLHHNVDRSISIQQTPRLQVRVAQIGGTWERRSEEVEDRERKWEGERERCLSIVLFCTFLSQNVKIWYFLLQNVEICYF